MRKKRLFEFSLIIALSASFITLQINPARIASAQDAKVRRLYSYSMTRQYQETVKSTVNYVTQP